MEDDGTGVEEIVNRISDMDVEWWPFLFLRPKVDEPLANGTVLAMAALYGVFAGMFANVMLVLTHSAHYVHVSVFPLAATVSLFVAFKSTVALAWNRRAKRIAGPTRTSR